ncbi:hypothetical protein M514_06949 [Trichuris suis]|uniref:Uncharacterized protein n=1 Tax=Trichuris suis TaxID=68888 RepID=A0A085NLH1_9BILA|nr:hypothetical protein M514_06949 [Trichuris suis]
MSQLSLQVWPAEFLLPSIDAKCLQYMACAKFCAAPVRIEPSVSPWSTSKGNYPEIRGVNSGRTYYDFREFVYLLQTQQAESALDGGMDEFTPEMEALKALTFMHIYPAYAIDFAKYGLKLLSKRLAGDKYFFGNRPSSVDAFIFGCLAPLIYIPLPDNRLQVFLRSQCSNLVRFVSSIINTYMPLPEDEVRAHQERMALWEVYREEYSRDRQRSTSSVTPSAYPLWEKIVFGIVAASLSLAFAIGCGVIQVQ